MSPVDTKTYGIPFLLVMKDICGDEPWKGINKDDGYVEALENCRSVLEALGCWDNDSVLVELASARQAGIAYNGDYIKTFKSVDTAAKVFNVNENELSSPRILNRVKGFMKGIGISSAKGLIGAAIIGGMILAGPAGKPLMGPAVSEAGIVSTLANVLIGGIYMSSSNGSINLSYDGDYAKYRAARAIVSSITGTMAEKISHAADEKRKEKEKSSAEKETGENLGVEIQPEEEETLYVKHRKSDAEYDAKYQKLLRENGLMDEEKFASESRRSLPTTREDKARLEASLDKEKISGILAEETKKSLVALNRIGPMSPGEIGVLVSFCRDVKKSDDAVLVISYLLEASEQTGPYGEKEYGVSDKLADTAEDLIIDKDSADGFDKDIDLLMIYTKMVSVDRYLTVNRGKDPKYEKIHEYVRSIRDKTGDYIKAHYDNAVFKQFDEASRAERAKNVEYFGIER